MFNNILMSKKNQIYRTHSNSSKNSIHYHGFVIVVKLKYTQQQKKRENLLVWNWLKIKYVEFKKYILHVKLTVY